MFLGNERITNYFQSILDFSFWTYVLLHFWAFVGSQFISDTFSHHLSGLGSNARQWLNINPISNIKLYIYTILYCNMTLCIDNLHIYPTNRDFSFFVALQNCVWKLLSPNGPYSIIIFLLITCLLSCLLSNYEIF